ncbi:hypothetical protein C475_04106 [Halosimplex carlsbadense 2-9-1]|uniref:Uncharacterized protein n=1 Tax=Halosimplex carlsbadense 2-9-1 TaxID=797114 RepID=M0D3Q2_9EURY|nr:hypothetical protein [Halosimplex carlsbadense]ELZ28789.1 hypothetical protein C475_04106 [Halosimplex carlsbadense 2-9-1]
MAANADPPEQGELHPCTDRQSAGESCGHSTTDAGATGGPDGGVAGRAGLTVDHTAETLYLTKIALLEARVSTLERRLESSEADRQHVVDRYERVLQGRDACRDEPLVTDEFDIEASGPADADRTAGDDRTTGDDRTAERDGDRSTGPLDRLRGLLG